MVGGAWGGWSIARSLACGVVDARPVLRDLCPPFRQLYPDSLYSVYGRTHPLLIWWDGMPHVPTRLRTAVELYIGRLAQCHVKCP